mgnify:FL=1
MADMAPSKPAKGGALSTAGYYDPARIEVMLKSQLAELYGIIANYNRKTMDFCMHHYETCKQAEMENHELRTRLAVVRDSISAKGQKGDPLQSLMSRQHVQATKLLVKKDCEARSATAENAVLRDQLVQTTRIVHQLEEERRAATADSPHVMSLEEADVSPTTPGGNSVALARPISSPKASPKEAFEGKATTSLSNLSASKNAFSMPASRGDLVQEIKLPGHPFDDGAIFRSDSEDTSESEEADGADGQNGVRRRSGVLDMKRRLQHMLASSSTNVADMYSQTGCFQRIARHPWFDFAVMFAIALNSIWLGIDAAWNDSDVLIQTDPIFLVVENLFCFFFVIELTVRFGAYQRKISAFRDWEWVVDLVLVILMVLEIWALAIIQLALESTTPSTFNPAFLRLTRIFKFFRMVRLVRLLRYMPEVIILVKGLGVASRSVFFTLCILGLLIYVYGIAFKHLCKDTKVGEAYFSTLTQSMFTLLYSGCFFDNISTLAEMMFSESFIFGVLLMTFILLAPLTVMNMLVGVLVQVLQVLSQVENDAITTAFLHEQTSKIFSAMDLNNDGNVDIEEFAKLVKQPNMVKALHEADIDVTALINEADLIFNGQERLGLDEFVTQIQAFRRTNSVTIKDLLQFRVMVRKDTEEVLRAQNKSLQKSVRKANKMNRLK